MEQTREQQMFDLIEQWEMSELSINAFCKQHELKYATFHYWRKKQKGQLSTGFISVKQVETVEQQLELHYPNGTKLLLPTSTSLVTIQRLLQLSC